jgi:hypothetical protein
VLSLKDSQPAATTPLLVSLLQDYVQEREKMSGIRSPVSSSHDFADALNLDDDPLRSMPSEQQLQSSISARNESVYDDDPLRSLPSERQLHSSMPIRDESVEFDELEAELAQTKSRTPTPTVSAAYRTPTSPPESPPRDNTLPPDLPDLAKPRRTLDQIDTYVHVGAQSHPGLPAVSGGFMARDLDDLETELDALRPVLPNASNAHRPAPAHATQATLATQTTQKVALASGSLADAARALGPHSSGGASSSFVNAVSRSGTGVGVSGAKAALPPSLFRAESDRPSTDAPRVQGFDIGPRRRAAAGGGDGTERQVSLDGSYELDGSGENFEELDESVEDADESDKEHEVENSLALEEAVVGEESEVEIDYDDLGDVTPPESVDAADGMEFELEGASLDDEDFELDTEDVF